MINKIKSDVEHYFNYNSISKNDYSDIILIINKILSKYNVSYKVICDETNNAFGYVDIGKINVDIQIKQPYPFKFQVLSISIPKQSLREERKEKLIKLNELHITR